MRLVIDMQGAQTASRDRGIGRYTLSLVRWLIQIAEHHEVILFINAALREGADALITEFRQLLPQEQIVVFEPMVPLSFSAIGNRARVLAMETMREAMLVDLEPDVVLLTSLFEGYQDDALTSVGAYSSKIPTAVIHYDLIPLSMPGYLSTASQTQFFQRKVEQLQSADLLLAISQASCDDALERLDLVAGSVVNISAAVEHEFCTDSASAALARACHLRLGINRSFVLYVPGGFDSRKNFERLFDAFGKLLRKRPCRTPVGHHRAARRWAYRAPARGCRKMRVVSGGAATAGGICLRRAASFSLSFCSTVCLSVA